MASNMNSNVSALLERGFMTLEDGDFEKADGLFEDVLNQNPKCAEAYMGKLMVYYRVANAKDFAEKIYETIFSRDDIIKIDIGYDIQELLQDHYSMANDISKKVMKTIKETFEEGVESNIYELKSFNKNVDYIQQFCTYDNKSKSKGTQGDTYYKRYLQYATEATNNRFSISEMLAELVRREKKKEEKKIQKIEDKYSEVKILHIIEEANANIKALIEGEPSVKIDAVEEICKVLSESKFPTKDIKKTKYQEEERKRQEEERKRQEEERKHREEETIKSLDSVSVGTIVRLGIYEGEEIEWRILCKERDKTNKERKRILLIAEKAIDKIPYDEDDHNSWENCSLRQWLNNDFLNDSLSTFKERILPYNVRYSNNDKNDANYGYNNILDRIFLLCAGEVSKYFVSGTIHHQSDAEDRICKDRAGENCDWWLRPKNLYAAYTWHETDYVTSSGRFMNRSVDDDNVGVRPALWLGVDLPPHSDSVVKTKILTFYNKLKR